MASVYTMWDRTQRTPQRMASSLGRRSPNNSNSSGQFERANSNSSSPKSPKTPRFNFPARTLSIPSSREIEQEVNRNQFCEMLERNLRTRASEQEQLIGRRLESTSPTSPTIERPQSVRPNKGRAPTPEEEIDLTDSMNIPVPIRRPYPFNDDVIVVTPDDGEVVDLCTPNFRRNNGRSRNRRITNNTEDNPRIDNATRQRLTASRRLSSASGHRNSSRGSPTSNEGSSLVSSTSASTTTSTTNIGSANKAKVNDWSPGAEAEIRSLIQSKRRLRRKWQSSRNPIDKTILNKASKELREKLKYFNNKSISDYIES